MQENQNLTTAVVDDEIKSLKAGAFIDKYVYAINGKDSHLGGTNIEPFEKLYQDVRGEK